MVLVIEVFLEEKAGDYTDVNSIYYSSFDPKWYLDLNVIPTPVVDKVLVKDITPDTSVAVGETSIKFSK